MSVRCPCGRVIVLEEGSHTLFLDSFCTSCNAPVWLAHDDQARTKLLIGAWNELQSRAFVISIVFSALAVESELGRTFTKWKKIDSGLMTRYPSAFQKNYWVSTFRYGVIESLNRVSDFLTGHSFDAFVNSQSDLSRAVRDAHPASVSAKSLRMFFSRTLFWKRAEIIHGGRTDFDIGSAEDAFKSALTLFHIISEMDFSRRRKVEQSLRKLE